MDNNGKIQIIPITEKYRKGWDLTFGKKKDQLNKCDKIKESFSNEFLNLSGISELDKKVEIEKLGPIIEQELKRVQYEAGKKWIKEEQEYEMKCIEAESMIKDKIFAINKEGKVVGSIENIKVSSNDADKFGNVELSEDKTKS